ncbi:MAG: hypothetical protein QOF91_2444 [Alphaproteobacteria bacterium]|jgi:hypothetical protein|nr:hypothetical protein [Alphaproteobacteria bacterium]MEA3027159.1 hypothetical protein [Alphaproteobacteria bacterium]
MLRKVLIAITAGITIAAAGSLTSSRANAMPIGLPAAAIDQIGMTEVVALCFYIDGWNGPGMYQCGYRMRRGMGWHGRRDGGRHDGRRRGGDRRGHRH